MESQASDGFLLRPITARPKRQRPDPLGGATGADSIAGDWSLNVLKKEAEVYLANWNIHKTAAGPIRNRKMLKEGKPDIVVAFPGGSGTSDMIKIATAAGVKVFDIEKKLVYNESNSVIKFT